MASIKNRRKKVGILVTGGTGFVGRYVVKELSKHYAVRVFSRRKTNVGNAKIFVGNLLSREDIKKSLNDISIIVHLAAIILGNEKEIYSFNVKSTELLVEESMIKKINKFVFLSSENVMWSNQNAYGKSKKKCEQLVSRFKNHVILRSSVIYGKGSSVILGKVLNYVRNQKIIIIPGSGKSLMQPIYVEDVSRYIVNSLRYNAKGTYIIAGKSKITFNKFIDIASKILHVEHTKIRIPFWLLYPFVALATAIFKNPPINLSQLINLNTNRVYDISKTIKELRHSPVSIEQGLAKTLT